MTVPRVQNDTDRDRVPESRNLASFVRLRHLEKPEGKEAGVEIGVCK